MARTTQARVELSEDAIAEIERRLNIIESRLDEQPEVTITYFVPDSLKEGGAYVTTVERVKKFDSVCPQMELVGGKRISIDKITKIEGLF